MGGLYSVKWLNGEQRSLGFGTREFARGWRSDTEEGVVKDCKARIKIPKVLQMVRKVWSVECRV